MEDPNLANIGRLKPAAPPDAATVVVQSDASATDAHYTGHLRREITEDVQAMLLHVLSWGIAVPNGAVHTVQRLDDPALPMADLVDLHTDLSLAIAPATPRAVRHFREMSANQSGRGFLSKIPGVRRLFTVGLLFALGFIFVSLSGDINSETVQKSIYELSGITLATKLALVLCAAGIGATFAALFDIWNDLKLGRLDPFEESGIWVRMGLGIVAGLVLSEVVNAESAFGRTETAPQQMFSGPLLALIGGFSANILHSVIQGITKTFRRAFRDEEEYALKANAQMLASANARSQKASRSDAVPEAPRSPETRRD